MFHPAHLLHYNIVRVGKWNSNHDNAAPQTVFEINALAAEASESYRQTAGVAQETLACHPLHTAS